MDRRHLTYFLAVVEEGSVSAAARSLHLSQPSVSQAIRELERELKRPLFQRGGALRLTPAGRALVGPARRTLRAFEGVTAAVQESDHLTSGRLDIAVLPGFAQEPGARFVRRFREVHSGVRVRVHRADPGSEGFEILRRADAEVLVHDFPAPYPKHQAIKVHMPPRYAVFPPRTRLPHDGPIRLADLVRHKFVMRPAEKSQTRTWLLAQLMTERLSAPAVAVETDHEEMIIPLVLAGVGASLVWQDVALAAAEAGAVVRPIDFEIPRTCYVYYREGALSSAAKAFLELVEDSETDQTVEGTLASE